MGDRTRNPMSDQERDLIIALRMQGKTYPDLAKMTGRPIGTISSVLSAAIYDGKCPRIRDMDPTVKRKAR